MAGVLYKVKSNRSNKIKALLNNPISGREIIKKLMTERNSYRADKNTITIDSDDKKVNIQVKELSF
jgi:hypothetical protein